MYRTLKEVFTKGGLQMALLRSKAECAGNKKALQDYMAMHTAKDHKKLVHLLMLRQSGQEEKAEERTLHMQDSPEYSDALRTKAMVVGLAPLDMAEEYVRNEAERFLALKQNYLRAVIKTQRNKRSLRLMELGEKGLADTEKAQRLSDLLKHPVPHRLLTKNASLVY